MTRWSKKKVQKKTVAGCFIPMRVWDRKVENGLTLYLTSWERSQRKTWEPRGSFFADNIYLIEELENFLDKGFEKPEWRIKYEEQKDNGNVMENNPGYDLSQVEAVTERKKEKRTILYLTSWKAFNGQTWVCAKDFGEECLPLLRSLDEKLDHPENTIPGGPIDIEQSNEEVSRASLIPPPSKRSKREDSKDGGENDKSSGVSSTVDDGSAAAPISSCGLPLSSLPPFTAPTTVLPSSVLSSTALPPSTFPSSSLSVSLPTMSSSLPLMLLPPATLPCAGLPVRDAFRPATNKTALHAVLRTAALARRPLHESSATNRLAKMTSFLNGPTHSSDKIQQPLQRMTPDEGRRLATPRSPHTSVSPLRLKTAVPVEDENKENEPEKTEDAALAALLSIPKGCLFKQGFDKSQGLKWEVFPFGLAKHPYFTAKVRNPRLPTVAEEEKEKREEDDQQENYEDRNRHGSARCVPYDEMKMMKMEGMKTKEVTKGDDGDRSTPSVSQSLPMKNSVRSSKKSNVRNLRKVNGSNIKYTAFLKMEAEWKEKVYQKNSSIEGFGLNAKKDILEGELIMEYSGDLVRKEIAEMRDKQYMGEGRANYMFKLSEDWVLDATMKGGLSRFINHSCDPNCSTHIMKPENGDPEDRKIIIAARRKIEAHEELTFDYQFDLEEDDKIVVCRCGADNCKGRLN